MITIAQAESIIGQARKVYDQHKFSIDADVRMKATALDNQCKVIEIHLKAFHEGPYHEREDRLAVINTEIFKLREINGELGQTVRSKKAQGIDISSAEPEVYIEGRTRTKAAPVRPVTVDNEQKGEINRDAATGKLRKIRAAAAAAAASSDAAKTSHADYASAVVTHERQAAAEKQQWVRGQTNPSAPTPKVIIGGK